MGNISSLSQDIKQEWNYCSSEWACLAADDYKAEVVNKLMELADTLAKNVEQAESFSV